MFAAQAGHFIAGTFSQNADRPKVIGSYAGQVRTGPRRADELEPRHRTTGVVGVSRWKRASIGGGMAQERPVLPAGPITRPTSPILSANCRSIRCAAELPWRLCEARSVAAQALTADPAARGHHLDTV